ncbi:hypothetical protein HPB52_017082 [Rhipicephalus sanguineus]|uniref:Transmembrane protein n=1 Tax=Rhipicephalus sanguineus TaxID=34632 RepID=A0A9D4PP65_RHISA|nr:hypothetical protein HPB52_017082 [Rhipicephalus sanguineus]
MDSTSLIFSGGRPGKASSVASFVALTLALGTLVVAAFVLFTAFTGWSNLAVSMQLRALDPLVAKAKTDEGVRAAPVLSDGSEWLVKELTALSEDASINGSAFFLGLNGSGPRHHNHSKHGQRPIFVPEGPAHEHKIFAGSASTSEQPSPLTTTTLTTKRSPSSGTSTRQPSVVKTSSMSLTTEGSQQPTMQKSHEGTVVQIRESRLTMSFHRPHRHDAANVTDLPPTSEYTYVTSESAHRRHDGDVDDIRTRASSKGQGHEGHVPRIPERSSPAGDTGSSGSSVILTMPGKSEEVQPTSSTFSFGSAVSPRVPDCTTTSSQPSPVTVGETEPFNEDVEIATSGGLVPSSRKHDHVRSGPPQGTADARDSHYGTTHKSHVRKLKVATLKAIIS